MKVKSLKGCCGKIEGEIFEVNPKHGLFLWAQRKVDFIDNEWKEWLKVIKDENLLLMINTRIDNDNSF